MIMLLTMSMQTINVNINLISLHHELNSRHNEQCENNIIINLQ